MQLPCGRLTPTPTSLIQGLATNLQKRRDLLERVLLEQVLLEWVILERGLLEQVLLQRVRQRLGLSVVLWHGLGLIVAGWRRAGLSEVLQLTLARHLCTAAASSLLSYTGHMWPRPLGTTG